MYTVCVWDYDCAPDGGGYYLYGRHRFAELRDAIGYAERSFETFVGAAVFDGYALIRAFGVYDTNF